MKQREFPALRSNVSLPLGMVIGNPTERSETKQKR